MPRRSKEDAEKTLEALLDAAAGLFTSQGFAKTTLAQIAEAAHVTRGAIYWHFDDKDDIIQKLYTSGADPLVRRAKQKLADLDDSELVSGFYRIIVWLLQQLEDNPRAQQSMRIITHNIEMTEEGSALQTFLFDERRVLEIAVETAFHRMETQGLLRQPLSYSVCADVFMAFFHALMLRNSTTVGDLPKATDPAISLDIFMKGILAACPPESGGKNGA